MEQSSGLLRRSKRGHTARHFDTIEELRTAHKRLYDPEPVVSTSRKACLKRVYDSHRLYVCYSPPSAECTIFQVRRDRAIDQVSRSAAAAAPAAAKRLH